MSKLTVIFDMDGVIIDSEQVYQEIERIMYRELGIQVSREEHLEFMGTAEQSMWKHMCERHKIDRHVQDLVDEERNRFMKRLEKPGSIPLMEGLIPLLKSLKSEGIPCWIASSSSSGIIDRVLKINELGEYFNGYVSGDDVTRSKPSPEIFLTAASHAKRQPADCIVIEDSPNGIQAARAAGMKVVALQPPGREASVLAGADMIINSLGEIDVSALKQ
jgi:HAD superfamily hydrolase (TIGR01509 family)